jgi:hypothetical protein
VTAADRADRERLAQGLGKHVTNDALLDQVVELLAGVEQGEGARTGQGAVG